MHIYYWCPYLTNIATIKSVIKSAKSLKKYIKNDLGESNEIVILNSCGEWSFLKDNPHDVKIKNLLPYDFFRYIPKEGLIQSRLSFLLIFFTNFFPLLFLVKNDKPKFLIVHLLTLLPIVLSPFLSKHTKIILRISGLPELNFFRKIIWKIFSKYIYVVTAPTKTTHKFIINSKIFDKNKIKLLRDPIIEYSEINRRRKIQIDPHFKTKTFYLSIGRLTGQKNFSFLIKMFSENIKNFKIKRLLIIGEGEEKNNLKKLIKKYKMEKCIFLLGFKDNVYNYINHCEALISVAEYEDPGFALIETIFLKKKLICSLVKNGPIEMYNNGDICYFFSYNNELEFLDAIKNSENNFKNKTLEAFQYSKEFTTFSHFKNLKKILYERIN
tara:strand:- start:2485 stop:3633 length:1149 start_codon:yes stop_codon:yes gene_type:complete